MVEIGINSSPLVLKEYGRNVQKLVNYVTNLPDKEERTRSAHTLISLMKQVTPSLRETPENEHKLWDDLFIMSNFKLDIDSPYPKPEPEILTRKPKKLQYNQHNIRYEHYGQNIILMIDKASRLEDEEEKKAAIIQVGKLMKSFYVIWNKENIDDIVIVDNIKEMSNGQLEIDVDVVKSGNLFETGGYKDRSSSGREKKSKKSYSGGSRKRKN
ncbi:MAG: DUF4290 domain-containing protein [Cyclobacteriaceae bacterium]